MRTALVAATVLAVFAATPVLSQSRAERGLVIDVKPRSWLDPGTSVPVGTGRDYVTNTSAFGGAPTNGIGGRYDTNLPAHGTGRGIPFEFLGANVVR